ncbi:hypothetical protein CL6EHI_018640 [Entamoeba histolytica]|uniref:Sodium/calcium exchanger membrane region domain-containing protein n=3 Tax=Entamoeba histolytica TaxID=5759 RepID=C4MA70_ENTH1|nr:hypothetical protein EHI_018640 [Entamoeba histolytica HM-1:IMSS]EAL49386.2 hypothetical protein EHI_018640 [Entamoeba histolytica HM-1:IMSS]ENY62243.1 hypothetical protein EHI7A_154960 [Entamoeba histolytica HM-1:IMSS-A]GAT98659.1 hypothetical protein CL6EHI_018640 [Entamoeba histolytica]|eukprot:XP_654771.2 hypothetical protein EHI_018640 [Entamoeba histolytica HM-1:IMSS]
MGYDIIDIKGLIASHPTGFEKYGGFLFYLVVIFQLGYFIYKIIDKKYCIIFNRFSTITTYIIRTKFFVELIMVIGQCSPEIIMTILGIVFNTSYSVAVYCVIGSSFCATIIGSSLASLNSYNPIQITPFSYQRTSIILLFNVLIYELFTESINKNGNSRIGTLLLVVSLGIFIIYYLLNQIISRVTNKNVQNIKEFEYKEENDTMDIINDEEMIKCGLVLVKNINYSETYYTTSQWKELWVDLYYDEIVIRSDKTAGSKEIIKIPITTIEECDINLLDKTIFVIKTFNKKEIGMRSLQRYEWVKNIQKLINRNENKQIDKDKQKIQLEEILKYDKFEKNEERTIFKNIIFFLPNLIVDWTIPIFQFPLSGIITFVIGGIYISISEFIILILIIRISAVTGISEDSIGIGINGIIGMGMRFIINSWNGGFKGMGSVVIENGYSQAIFMMSCIVTIPWIIFYFIIEKQYEYTISFNQTSIDIILFGMIILISLYLLISILSSKVIIKRTYSFIVIFVYFALVISSIIISSYYHS